MPPQSGPSLTVQANPVNTYVAAAAPAVALYDQQQVAMAQQLVSAFSDLSVTAARFAGSMKAEQNEEEIRAGMDLVNKSRKSYQKLVESGEIKPTENPWMAVGAQQASGTMEGMRARADFERIYAMKAADDPKFFENPEAFDALAAQYVQNANVNLGDASYQTRSFYEAFNPYIASKAMQHEEAIAKYREEKIITGLGASVAKAVEDYSSPDPIVRNEALAALQESMDIVTGVSRQRMNNTVTDFLIEQMETSDNPEIAEGLYKSLKAGTGPLSETEYAKYRLSSRKAQIEQNRNRMTIAESRAAAEWIESSALQAVKTGMTKDQYVASVRDKLSDGSLATLSAPEIESKTAWAMSRYDQAQKDQETARAEAIDRTLTTQIEASSIDTDVSYQQGLDSLRKTMDNLDLPLAQRWGVEKTYTDRYNSRAEERAQIQLEKDTRIRWYGEDGNSGIIGSVNSDINVFFGINADGSRRTPEQQMERPDGAIPEFGVAKQKVTDGLLDMGLVPDSDAAKREYKRAYTAIDKEISAREDAVTKGVATFRGTLKSLPDDTEDILREKASMRGRFLMLRMHLGSVFEDYRVVGPAVNNFINALNPQVVESSNFKMDPVVDMIEAYGYLKSNNLEDSALLPTGPNGKALRETLDSALYRLRTDNIYEVARDIASQRFFGNAGEITAAAFKSDAANFTGLFSGDPKDTRDFQENFNTFVLDMEVTNPDALRYGAYEFGRAYLKLVEESKNANVSVRKAGDAVRETNFFLRNSMIPRKGFDPSINESWLEAFLTTFYPNNPDATLVTVALEPTGEGIFAVRDADGNALPPTVEGQPSDPRFYRVSEFKTGGKFDKAINKRLIEEMQDKREQERRENSMQRMQRESAAAQFLNPRRTMGF